MGALGFVLKYTYILKKRKTKRLIFLSTIKEVKEVKPAYRINTQAMDCNRNLTMQFGTWNVRGLKSKRREVFTELEKYNMDIVALTETKKKGKGIEKIHGYIHIYSGVSWEQHARSGVSLAIKEEYKKYIKG